MTAPGVGSQPIFLSLSRGMCRVCRRPAEVRYVSDGQGVFLERFCREHGTSRALVAETLAWYLAALQAPSAARPPARTVPRTGECPASCGPCTFHGQACHLPVFSITNACDLRCPICFTYNRPDRAWFMSPEELDRHLDLVLASTGRVDLVNVTGGEPTLHPRLPELLRRCHRPGIGRVTVNTNGLRIAREPAVAEDLAAAGAYAILSLDTLVPERSVRLHGRDIVAEKLAALDALERAGVQTTLLMVLVGGVNEDELPRLLELLAARDHVRSLTIQTMTYTGQGGGSFEPRRHIPVEGVERRIEEATGGRIRRDDFLPLPAAHPLCYGVSYLLTGGGALHPLSRLLSRDVLARLLAEGYLLQPADRLEGELKTGLDRLWASGADPAILAAVKELVRTVYPGDPLDVAERQRRAEGRVKTIYVHAHMDEDTFEVGRAMRCPDQVPVKAERMIGACAYNLFHRQRDERFWVQDG